MSKLGDRIEGMRQDAADKAASLIIAALVAEGVPEARAMAFVDTEISLNVDEQMRVVATYAAAQLRARGYSPAYLEHFARSAHLHRPGLGGQPRPFGFEEPPEYEWTQEHAEKVAATRRAGAEAAERSVRDREALRQVVDEHHADSLTRELHERVTGAF